MIRLMFLLIYLVPGSWTNRSPPSSSSTPTSQSQNANSHQIIPQPNSKSIKLVTNCTREIFQIRLDMGKPFRGIVFAKEFSEECRTRGNFTSIVEMSIPAMGCGVRTEPKTNGMIEMSVRVVVQMDDKLRQKADVVKIAKCMITTDMMEMELYESEMRDEKKNYRNGRMSFDSNIDSETTYPPPFSPPPHVRVWLELGGSGGAGAVEVGEPTTLGIRALLPTAIGVKIVDCAALDGLGEASQKLLDERGCPIDEQVMPALMTKVRPIEMGKSKYHDDDIVEKLFSATFPAFKFPDRERLHVSCGVQLCHGKCPKVDCRSDDAFILLSENHLARIEVFNSLLVTAPQIDLDRVQQVDRRTQYNGNVDELQTGARRMRSEGTLCMSMSNLALAFCILGFIFLLAVIVAICCMLRGRARDRQYAQYNHSIFSSTSSTSHSPPQSRFGSKLLIPYTGATLPYGRVY